MGSHLDYLRGPGSCKREGGGQNQRRTGEAAVLTVKMEGGAMS